MNRNQILIRDVILYDGTGSAPAESDVLLREDRIAEVALSGKINPDAGIEELNGSGLSLAPGFIDTHSHSDISLLAAPEAFGKLSQGVTTEIVGNCGLSAFPVATEAVREHLDELYDCYNEKVTWNDLNGYGAELERRGVSVNVAALCGHNTLRASANGYEDIPLSPENLKKMSGLLAETMKQGAFGMSTGLLYIPGKFSTEEELLALMSELRKYDGIYTTHLRSEGPRLLEALEEALRLAEAGSGRLQISHLKTTMPENWHKLPAALDMIRNARARGLSVHADRYPYTYGQTSLSVILPPPYDKMTDSAIRDALAGDDGACEKLRTELETKDFWDGIILTYSTLPEYEPLFGLHMPEAAKRAGLSPASLTVDLMRRDAPGTLAAFGGLSPENMRTVIAQDWVCCGSDENARPRDYSIGRSHPRGFGSFPKFMRIAAENSGMADAVRKVTSLAASIFGIRERGLIRKGCFADLVLFDESRFRDTADFANPHSPADGVIKVWVNGKLSYSEENGATGSGAGKFLRK